MNPIVFVISWQLEENGTILRLGQEVEWWLAFRDASWWSLEPAEHSQHLTALASPIAWQGQEINHFPTELSAGETTLYWDAPEQVQGEVQLIGSIHRDVGVDTPEDFPSSRGVIRRLRMETRRYTNTGRRWDVLDNSATYEEVQETSLPLRDFPYATGRLVWTGVLVELETEANLSGTPRG